MSRFGPGLVGFRAIALAAAVSGPALAGCDMCDVGDLRCRGSVVEECNGNRNWEELHDCGGDRCALGSDACPDPWVPMAGGDVYCCLRSP